MSDLRVGLSFSYTREPTSVNSKWHTGFARANELAIISDLSLWSDNCATS